MSSIFLPLLVIIFLFVLPLFFVYASIIQAFRYVVKYFCYQIVKKRKLIPGGRARGLRVKYYLLHFTKIFHDLQPRCGVFHNYLKFALASK